jgi:hypothetical protein
MWRQIETSAGVYNWTAMDAYVAGCYAAGIDAIFSCLYMPSFYSQNAATASNYGVGSGGPLTTTGSPSGLDGYYNFIKAMLVRYKGKGTPLKAVQFWEEPWWPTSPSTPFITTSNYWWGTAAQLVDLCYRGSQACIDADALYPGLPATIRIAPSASPPVAKVSDYWSTAGTTYTTATGYNTCDVYGIDMFGYGPTNFNYGFDTTVNYGNNAFLSQPFDVGTAIANARTQMGTNVKPITVTSWGIGFDGSSTLMSFVRSQSATYRRQWTARGMLQLAALGIQNCIVYGGDAYTTISGGNTKYFSGDYVNDTTGVVAGFNDIAAIQGKTITFCGYRGDGQMIAAFTDGSTYTI